MKTKLFFSLATLFFSYSAFSQNVGIGTNSPTGRLHIDLTGTTNTFAIIIDDDDDDATIRFRRLGISKGFLQSLNGNDFRLGTYATNDSGRLILATSSVNRIYILPDGNTGVGIADPLSKLHINGGVDAGLANNASGYLMIGSSTGSNIVFDNNEILARNNGAAATLFLAREGSRLQLGNGTETTGTKLHISTGNDVDLTEANSGYLMAGSISGANIVMDNNEIQARSNGNSATLFFQNNGGNVRIGTGSFLSSHLLGVGGDVAILGGLRVGNEILPSGYKFGVDGRMICTEVLVRLVPNWPDYVFSKQYSLRNIDDLEKFIQENGHLPNIPSAKQIEKDGLTLGEMQKLQMEKIEELTLYIIQLKKEIDELKQKKQHE